MKNEWNTDRRSGDNIEVNDGTLRYYTRRGKYENYGLQQVARDFAATYDHNDDPGAVECVATNLNTGREYHFECRND